MSKDNIVQFIGFVTKLKVEEFSQTWEGYCRQFKKEPGTSILQAATDNFKYRYISQHHCGTADFRFTFMKGRNSEHFPEQTAKVVQLGGYIAVQFQEESLNQGDGVKVFAFLDHRETELEFYKQQSYQYLNMYEAYYENCSYGYILEYFVKATEAPELIEQLKAKNRNEISLFKEIHALVVAR